MPSRHRQNPQSGPGLVRASSGGASSRTGLNLHFTQNLKDPFPPPPHQHLPENLKTKKNGHGLHPHEANTRTTSRTARLPSKEQIQPPLQKRPLAGHTTTTKHQGAKPKPKAGFTLASPGTDDEEDWVSSESGAATPNRPDSDDDEEEGEGSDSPVVDREQQKTPVVEVDPALTQTELVIEAPIAATPRADSPLPLPRITTARPSDLESTAIPPLGPPTPPPRLQDRRLSLATSEIMETRSETTSPTHHPHSRHRHAGKQQSMTRPPSTHSVTSRSDAALLRPHPLIRGQSYGQGGVNLAPKPSPLAPLTVTSDPAQAQISASPPLSTKSGPLSSSPTSVKTTSASPNGSSSNPFRRSSVSSARSVATLPAPNSGSVSQQQGSRPSHDRHRTLSTISSTSSSSFTALSSLAHLPTVSRPATPQLISYFPPANPHAHLEAIHPLLPPPYLNTHMTVLAYRTPIREVYDRVIRAKQSR